MSDELRVMSKHDAIYLAKRDFMVIARPVKTNFLAPSAGLQSFIVAGRL
jgi:hypothetical protein